MAEGAIMETKGCERSLRRVKFTGYHNKNRKENWTREVKVNVKVTGRSALE